MRTSLNLSIKYSQQTYYNFLLYLCLSSSITAIDYELKYRAFKINILALLDPASRIMESLTSVISKCKLELKLDNPTEGFGNCFPNAIVQQCRRPEIKTWIQKNRPWALLTGHQMLRRKVTNFALRPRDRFIKREHNYRSK